MNGNEIGPGTTAVVLYISPFAMLAIPPSDDFSLMLVLHLPPSGVAVLIFRRRPGTAAWKTPTFPTQQPSQPRLRVCPPQARVPAWDHMGSSTRSRTNVFALRPNPARHVTLFLEWVENHPGGGKM
jgi:hypothetical protein